jgi:hypothetical protein
MEFSLVLLIPGLSNETSGRDSGVSIATGYMQDGKGAEEQSPGNGKTSLLPMSSRFALGTLSPGGGGEGKQPRDCKADHPPPTNTEVKNTWIYTSTLPYLSMAKS